MHQSPVTYGRSRGTTSSSICILLFAAVVLQSIQPRLALPTRFRREVADQPDASQQAAAEADPSAADPGRKDRSLSFFDNFINMAAAGLGGMTGADGGGGLAGDIVGALGGNLGGGLGGFGGGGGAYENEADVDLYNEAISRTIPRRKIAGGYGGQQFGGPSYSNSPAYSNSPGYSNSPVYYIRMPPSPYVFVPGLGYVSPPPSMPNNPLGNYQPAPLPQSPFVNLPLEYVSNAKPSGVYTWGMKKPRPSKPSKTQTTPKPYQKPTSSTKPTAVSKPQYAWPQPSIKPLNQFDSPVTNLQGQYTFNGRPSGLYVLKNPFSSFYSDVLQSFYP
ncbi:heterogeneous nuclear ribonucleoprotein U-like protein 1 [Ischnura elegans]|uniref:heterogeneous nuclear ribonucleoprotein U-like protein 1 n=1 Tax=Ischnura elegans TaxID=197161 RepID=UPI001ED885A5|nr:heterogeneous nuclear ribonucleoprotein U-like protein 1 [Ischnura elegans]